MTTVDAPRRGRPRDETLDATILAAAVDELVERGFAGLSMEGVAARAGVAKTTLYRRWSSAEELGIDALRTFEDDALDPPPGSPRDDLLWLVNAQRRRWGNPKYAAIMRALVADGAMHPDAYKRGRESLIAPYSRRIDAALARCVDAGLIRPDADFDLVRAMIVSPIVVAAMTRKTRLTRQQVETVVDTVLRGAAPDAPSG